MPYQTFDIDAPGDSDSLGKWQALALSSAFVAGKSVLDLGCNEGWFCGRSLECGARRVVGVDRSPDFVWQARRRFPDVEFVEADWDNWMRDECTERFDVVLLLSSFHYCHDHQRTLGLIHDRLNADGLLVLECGIATDNPFRPQPRWVPTARGASIARHPTWSLLEQLLERYSWRWIGPSVAQKGDPVDRYVFHCRPRKTTAYLIGGVHASGKTSLSRLCNCAVFGLDDHLHLLARYAPGLMPWPQSPGTHFLRDAYRAIEDRHADEFARSVCDCLPGGDVAIEGGCLTWERTRSALTTELQRRGYWVWRASQCTDVASDILCRASGLT